MGMTDEQKYVDMTDKCESRLRLPQQLLCFNFLEAFNTQNSELVTQEILNTITKCKTLHCSSKFPVVS